MFACVNANNIFFAREQVCEQIRPCKALYTSNIILSERRFLKIVFNATFLKLHKTVLLENS